MKYTEAKVDVTQEIEQRAQQAAQAGARPLRPLFYFLCYIHFNLSVQLRDSGHYGIVLNNVGAPIMHLLMFYWMECNTNNYHYISQR